MDVMNALGTTMELPVAAPSAATARRLVTKAARGAICFSQGDVDDLCVAVGEAFANAVRHGVSRPDAAMEFVVEVASGGLRVLMTYPSAPFNTCPDAPDPEDMATGGYGIFLMRALADVVDFQFENGNACIRIEKFCRRCHPGK